MLLAGVAALAVAVISLIEVSTAYYPLQPVVQVIAPFLGISIFTSVGISLVVIALLLPRGTEQHREQVDMPSAIDSLLSQSRRR